MKKKICPRCGKGYAGYPAISRVDNETEICSDCGLFEALAEGILHELIKDGDIEVKEDD